jgi:DMSO/TMAO reductase YedYZ heme-binding membrane subunit
VEYLWGLGDFKLQNTPERKVMIVTGTGLAPMIAMLRALPESNQKLVIFGGRYEKDLYYLDLIESFKNVELVTCVSRAEDNYTWNKGRVTNYLHKIHPEDEVYICGNPDMVHDTINHLSENGHFREKMYHEDFTLSTKPSWILKTIFFEGNLPGILTLQKILIFLWIFIVPVLYFIATKNTLMNTDIFWKTLYTRLFDLSWYAVVFVMLVRPLADLFPKLGIFRRLVVLRKWFWILSASVIVSALLAKWIQNPVTFSALITSPAWALWYPLLARLSEFTAIILLITSNSFSQRKLGIWWKYIQKTSYIYFVTGGIIAARWSPDKFIYETIAIVCILWILAQLRLKIWK